VLVAVLGCDPVLESRDAARTVADPEAAVSSGTERGDDAAVSQRFVGDLAPPHEAGAIESDEIDADAQPDVSVAVLRNRAERTGEHAVTGGPRHHRVAGNSGRVQVDRVCGGKCRCQNGEASDVKTGRVVKPA